MEDGERVLLCQSEGAKEQWKTSVEKLRSHLVDNCTGMEVLTAICDGLEGWYNNSPRIERPYNEEVVEALKNQDSIGWRALLEGCPATGWAEAQQAVFDGLGSKRTSRRWATAMVKKMMDTAWDMWDHRNSVEHDVLTSTESTEVNARIAQEYNQGFCNLDRKAKKLTKASKEQMEKKPLGYRKAWLLSIGAARKRAKDREEEGRPPQGILDSIGWVAYRRMQTGRMDVRAEIEALLV